MSKKTRKQKSKQIVGQSESKKASQDLHSSTKSQITADLRKTILLTIFLFALEFLIFYANLK